MTIRGTLLLTVAVCLGACASSFEAMYDHDSSADFTAYETFAWISEHPMTVGATDRAVNPLLETRIMNAVDDALKAKGYRYVPQPESADIALAFTVGSRDEIKVDSYPSMSAGYAGAGYPRHWGGWGGAYYGYGTQTSVRQYTKGMLAVDIFDVSERKPVWHGVAEKSINESDREDAEGTIKAAVAAVLAGFPPM